MASKNNIEVINDEYAIMTIVSKKYGTHSIYIDVADIDKVSKYTWHVRPDYSLNKEVFYAESEIYISRKERHTISMHRVITNCPKGMVVDHINHNTLDNRKVNLKVCTQYENCQNRLEAIQSNKPHKDNNLGIRYISKHKKGQRGYYVYTVRYKYGKRKETRSLFEALSYLISEVAKDVFC